MFTSKSKSSNEESVAASNSIIGSGTSITGNIETTGDLRIDGTLKGNVCSKAKVLIGPTGVVEGNVYCCQADILGQVTGSLTATELLQLKGKAAVGSYWDNALKLFPNLHFELITTLVGVNSITLYYKGVRGLSAEVFHFNQDGKVTRAYAHYL